MIKHQIFRWLVVAVVGMSAMFFGYNVLTTERKEAPSLPVYGERADDSSEHRIADWKFTDQNGLIISQKDLDGRIYVADFFFTTCKGICPKMSTQMERVAEKFRGNNDVNFLSHTVKPGEDSV